ncbi:hypothetical protein C8Q77DRAFT_1158275 [Trametes polyzona]|nr:hypothetical protein C8Q77DRAFT_1158275 [Trametes polyzona]
MQTLTHMIILAAIALSTQRALAGPVSLFIPFVDPQQAITADVEGVDTAKGETTWRVGYGVPSGTYTATPTAPPFTTGSATLVLGPTHVAWFQKASDAVYSADCSNSGGGVATCVLDVTAPGLQVDGTAPVTGATLEVQVATTTATTSAATTTTTSAAPTSSSTTTAKGKNGGDRTSSSLSMLAVGMGLIGGLYVL